jgi:hypothetical protein
MMARFPDQRPTVRYRHLWEENTPMPHKAILAGAALAAGLALTACGSGGGSAASAGPSGVPAASTPPQACLQQYRSWNSGPEHAAGENLVTALNSLEAAISGSDAATTSAALEDAGQAAKVLELYPIPKCADPKGYWHAGLLRIQAAADNASTSKGQHVLTLAEGALKQIPALDRQLAAELKHTVPALSQNR